jgi:hypothetical protein
MVYIIAGIGNGVIKTSPLTIFSFHSIPLLLFLCLNILEKKSAYKMTDASKLKASDRLTKITDALTFNKTATTVPFDPDCTRFPSRKELPEIPGAPTGA